MKIERTLVLLKPDTVQRGIMGEIISRFEKVGLKIVGLKMVSPDKDHFYHHYETIGQVITRRGQKVFDSTLDMMTSGPVVAMVLEGVGSAELVRKMVGSTEPKSALPGTIRGDYSHLSYEYADEADIALPNIVHASGDSMEAALEVAHWFSEAELFDYQNVHEVHTIPKSKTK